MNRLMAIVAMLSAISVNANTVLRREVEYGNISQEGAQLLEEVILEVGILGLENEEAFVLEVETRFFRLARERHIEVHGENKNLAVRNTIRVIVGVLRPGTANAPTHDGRGRLPSK